MVHVNICKIIHVNYLPQNKHKSCYTRLLNMCHNYYVNHTTN